MNIGSRLAQDPARVAIDDETTPEERLQRLVLESLRAEYEEEAVTAVAVQPPPPERVRTGRLRGLTLFLALVIATTAAGGLALLILGRQEIEQDPEPGVVATTEPVQPAPPVVSQPPIAPENVSRRAEVAIEAEPPKAQADNAAPISLDTVPPSPGTSRSLDPVPAKPSIDNPSNPAPFVAPRPSDPPRPNDPAKPNDPPRPNDPAKPNDPPRSGSAKSPVAQRETGTGASPSPARAIATAREPEQGKPVVWIYYPIGATQAGETARTLAARIAPDAARVDYGAQADMPRIAVIRFSVGKNEELAKAVGKTLGNLGFRWKIEDVSKSVSTPHNMVEIWLPARQDTRQ